MTDVSEQSIIVYGHNTCPMMPAVFNMLQRAKVPYTYLNIHQDTSAREFVRQVNDGYESVPTLVFPDGITLTEPGSGELRRKLQAMGYNVPLWTVILGHWQWLLIGIGVGFAILRATGVL